MAKVMNLILRQHGEGFESISIFAIKSKENLTKWFNKKIWWE